MVSRLTAFILLAFLAASVSAVCGAQEAVRTRLMRQWFEALGYNVVSPSQEAIFIAYSQLQPAKREHLGKWAEERLPESVLKRSEYWMELVFQEKHRPQLRTLSPTHQLLREPPASDLLVYRWRDHAYAFEMLETSSAILVRVFTGKDGLRSSGQSDAPRGERVERMFNRLFVQKPLEARGTAEPARDPSAEKFHRVSSSDHIALYCSWEMRDEDAVSDRLTGYWQDFVIAAATDDFVDFLIIKVGSGVTGIKNGEKLRAPDLNRLVEYKKNWLPRKPSGQAGDKREDGKSKADAAGLK